MKPKVGKHAKIRKDNDNENYEKFRGKELVITNVAYNTTQHPGYDSGLEGQALCDFKVAETDEDVPFSLYEYEFICY